MPVNNNIDDMNEKLAEVNDLTKSINRLSIDENSDSRILTLRMTVHGVNVNLYHALQKLQGSTKTTSMF